MSKPLIVVSGATGAQGGSVANALLATGQYKIRGLTRNPNSDRAKALASEGVEMVKCDLAVKDDVKNALKGADIAWIVTNFWDPSIIGTDPSEEERQGRMIADVAKEEGVKWFIYSSLPDTTTESDGKLSDIIHFAGKNRVEQYIRSLGFQSTTFIYLAFYSQNIGTFMPLIPKDNGEIELVFLYLDENDTIPIVDAANDTGPIVAKIIEEGPDKWNGKKVPVAGEYASLKSIVDSLTKATGKTHKLKTVSNDDDIKEYPVLDNTELKQMLQWFKLYGYYGKDNEVSEISVARKLHPNIQTYEQFVLKTYGKA